MNNKPRIRKLTLDCMNNKPRMTKLNKQEVK